MPVDKLPDPDELSYTLPKDSDHSRFDDIEIDPEVYATIEEQNTIVRQDYRAALDGTLDDLDDDELPSTPQQVLDSNIAMLFLNDGRRQSFKAFNGPKAKHPSTPKSPLLGVSEDKIRDHVLKTATERANSVFSEVKDRLLKDIRDKFAEMPKDPEERAAKVSETIIPRSSLKTKWMDAPAATSIDEMLLDPYKNPGHPRRLFHSAFGLHLEYLYRDAVNTELKRMHPKFNRQYKTQAIFGYKYNYSDPVFYCRVYKRD